MTADETKKSLLIKNFICFLTDNNLFDEFVEKTNLNLGQIFSMDPEDWLYCSIVFIDTNEPEKWKYFNSCWKNIVNDTYTQYKFIL